MPTGYTHDLEERNYDLKGWLKEGVIRAMGVCVSLRDSGNMTVAEIKKALKSEASESYHAKKLKEAQARFEEFKSLNDAQLVSKHVTESATAKKAFEERTKEFNRKKAAHEKAMKDADALLKAAKDKGANEVTIGTLEFAVEQLASSYRFDYGSGPYKDEILTKSRDQWIRDQHERLLSDIEYHGKEIKKDDLRKTDRFREYEKFVEFVDSQLPLLDASERKDEKK